MEMPQRILVVQTAYIGDVILTLPLVQILHLHCPDSHIDFVAIPTCATVLSNHPALREIITYDKRGKDAGLGGALSLVRQLRSGNYDCALVPHRSIRSALIVWMSGIPRRIGFSSSAGRFLFTDTVTRESQSHEIRRNVNLLKPLGLRIPDRELPTLYPSQTDRKAVDDKLAEVSARSSFDARAVVAIAPGSVWNTKRWPKAHFASLARMLVNEGLSVALVGSMEDRQLCGEIEKAVGDDKVSNFAGTLSLLQSAELIRRSQVLLSNDSAPMHLAVAVRTPVIAIFGATVPAFGFAPLGERDQVVETLGLSCRPCSIHGGETCPIKTFDCMTRLTPEHVLSKIAMVIGASKNVAQKERQH